MYGFAQCVKNCNVIGCMKGQVEITCPFKQGFRATAIDYFS